MQYCRARFQRIGRKNRGCPKSANGQYKATGRRFSARTLDYARAINIACNRAVGRESEKGVCYGRNSLVLVAGCHFDREKAIRRCWLIYRGPRLFIASPFAGRKSTATRRQLSLRKKSNRCTLARHVPLFSFLPPCNSLFHSSDFSPLKFQINVLYPDRTMILHLRFWRILNRVLYFFLVP